MRPHPLRHLIAKAWSEGMHEPTGKAKELLKDCVNFWRLNSHEYYPIQSDKWTKYHDVERSDECTSSEWPPVKKMKKIKRQSETPDTY